MHAAKEVFAHYKMGRLAVVGVHFWIKSYIL